MAYYADVYAFHKYLVVMSDLLCNKLFIDCVIPCLVTKVGGLMHLACMAIPGNVCASSVFRAACLLTRILASCGAENSDAPLACHKAAICHAFLLLLISMELQDKRSK